MRFKIGAMVVALGLVALVWLNSRDEKTPNSAAATPKRTKLTSLKELKSSAAGELPGNRSNTPPKSLDELISDYDNALNDHDRYNLLDPLCEALAQRPEFVEHWLLQKVNRLSNTELFEKFAYHFAIRDPEGAEAMLSRFPVDLRSRAFVIGALQGQASYDFRGSYERLNSKASTMEKIDVAKATYKIFETAARSQSWQSLTPVIDEISDVGKKRGAGLAVLNVQLQTGDFSIAKWVAESSTTPSGPKYFGELISKWARTDSAAAAEWILAQPASAAKDTGIAKLADTLAATDPSQSLEWLAKISDPPYRLKLSENMLARFYEQDPNAAISTIENIEALSNAEKAQLLDSVYRRGE